MTRDRFTGPARSPFNVSSAIKWKNTSGGTIPAYGVIKLSGYDAIGDYFNAVKPDGEGNLHFVNGPVAVAANAYGGSQLWNHSRIGKTSSTTFGATVGPVDDSWEMEETGSGFVTFSDPSGGVAAILQVGGGSGDRLQVIMTTDLFAAVNTKRDPSTATCRVLVKKPDGDLTLSTRVETVVNRFRNISIDAGTYAKIEWIDGEWQPYAADCPGESSGSDYSSDYSSDDPSSGRVWSS